MSDAFLFAYHTDALAAVSGIGQDILLPEYELPFSIVGLCGVIVSPNHPY